MTRLIRGFEIKAMTRAVSKKLAVIRKTTTYRIYHAAPMVLTHGLIVYVQMREGTGGVCAEFNTLIGAANCLVLLEKAARDTGDTDLLDLLETCIILGFPNTVEPPESFPAFAKRK
jgi:hypothetical protein